MIGSNAYNMIPAAGCAAVITGFEPVDIMEGIWMILEQIANKKYEVAIQYSRGVKPKGNIRAMELINTIFKTETVEWRGIGPIPASGLVFRKSYAAYDAQTKFAIPEMKSIELKGCGCGDILRGIKSPEQCSLFKKVCTPMNPIGPCMVSSEGTCATYYKYY
jgi:hydrogenase expression/formation protein HypD